MSFTVAASVHAGENATIFEPFVGDWDVDVTYHRPDGTTDTASGSWRFRSTLEGRAVQDDWRVSSVRTDPSGFGTTVRFYDPSIDAWRVTWHGVLTGVVYKFIARRQGSEIVMEREDTGEQLTRWIFSDVERESFRWRNVSSRDGGTSWVLEQEMTVRRRAQERSGVIVRIWRGYTTPDKANDYESLLKTEIFPGIAAKNVAGYRGIQLLRRHVGAEVEFVTIMSFDSWEAVREFAGEDYEAAYVPEKARMLLSRFDARSQHYETRHPIVR